LKIRKSINSARGYFDDDANAKNDLNIMSTLARTLYDCYHDTKSNGIPIIADYVVDPSGMFGVPEFSFLIDTPRYVDELWVVVYAFPRETKKGKLTGRLLAEDGDTIIEEFDIPMSGSKQFIINKIDEITSGINSQGVESSMKIRRNRVTANKRRAVKAAYKEIRDYDAYGYNEDGELAYEYLPYALDSVDEVTAWLKAMLAGVEEFKSEWSEWGGSTSEIEMFVGPDDAHDFGVKMYSDIIQNGLEPLAKELGDLLDVYIYPDDSDY